MKRKFFSLLLALAASVGITSAAITVRLDPQSCSSWSTVCLWAWTSDGNVFSQWPGELVSKDADGWYSYTFASSISNVSIIWNNGDDQTVDITNVTESTCFALDGEGGKKITVSTVDCQSSANPTAAELSQLGYNVSNNVVLCCCFDERVCNDVVLAGSYNNWDVSDVSKLYKFEPIRSSKYTGWYVAEMPFDANAEYVGAKPVLLRNNGTFSWDYQCGDKDAWIYRGGQTADVQVSENEGECNVNYPSAGAYIYEIAYWKLHNNPCNLSNYKVYYYDTNNYSFAVFYWNNASSNSVTMTPVSGHSGWYEASLPEDCTSLLFVAYPLNTTFSWDSYTYKTDDLVCDGTNVYYVHDEGWQDGFGETTTPSFPTDEPLIWPIAMDETTVYNNQSVIVSDLRPNGYDNNLWVWENTYTSGSVYGTNFFGQYEGYVALTVTAPSGWSGLGFNIANAASLTAIKNLQKAIETNPDNYYLHLAIKSTDNASHQFYIFGTDNTSFVIGTQAIEKGTVIGDFNRDGTWQEFYIPMAQFASAIAANEINSSIDILCVLSGNQVGAQLNLDAVYFCNKYAKENNIPAVPEPYYYDHVKIGDLYYNLNVEGRTAEVTYEEQLSGSNYSGLTTANIPATVTYKGNTYSVTSIGWGAFYDCSDLTSVTLPNSVTYVGDMAFHGCSGLKDPVYNSHVFAYLPDAYEGRYYLVPEEIETIAYNAFSNKSYDLKVLITRNQASHYNGGSKIYIYDVILNGYVFQNVDVYVDNTPKNPLTINPATCDNTQNKCWKYSFKETGEDGIVHFSSTSCSWCTEREIVEYLGAEYQREIDDPNSTYTATNYSVLYRQTTASDAEGCNLSFYDAFVSDVPGWYLITYIGNEKNLTLPEKINGSTYEIVPAAFAYSDIQSAVLPEGITSIGHETFDNCTNLTSVNIPGTVTSIGMQAFLYCTSLTSLAIPASVTEIGSMAFGFCKNLTDLTVDANNPAYSAQGGVLFNKNKTTLIIAPGTSGVYTAPNSVTKIEMGAFSYNFTVTQIILPEGVTEVGMYAFLGCARLTSITLPSTLSTFGEAAIYVCPNLTEIYNYATTPQVIDEYMFGGCEVQPAPEPEPAPAPLKRIVAEDNPLEENCGPTDKSVCKLYVPQASIALYKAAEGWKDFKNILAAPAQGENEVTVAPTETSATIAWPAVEGAYTYELVIRDGNGNIVCTLTFDAEGRLTNIAFGAPARDYASQATGFSFTVTGLTSATTYSYTLQAKDSNGAVLQTETGSFTTLGGDAVEYVTAGKQSTKLLRDGQLFILRDGKMYNVQGQEMK